jgi:catechol 2,3-dioxygenase-like lactoylglutathione lyase family enzyme
MSTRIGAITVDCTDYLRLAEFWTQALGFGEHPDYPNAPGDPAWMLVSPDERTHLLFVTVPESKTVKNRIHFDLIPDDRTRDEEVARLIGLGATLVADHRRPDGNGWVTLADPEGNEFCVERSDAERAAARVTS